MIINDGSDDGRTVRKLESYADPRIIVINTPNQGVARARNVGISAGRGEYILPLDADDRIGADYVRRAVEVFDSDDGIGIVYCLGRFFDQKNGDWRLPPYSSEGVLLDNMIFCSALFRKTDWEKVKGYNPNMKNGYEDWDFWLSLVEMGLKVYRIPEALFGYRIRDAAARHLMTANKAVDLDMRRQLIDNHRALYMSPSGSGAKARLRLCVRNAYVLGIESRRWPLVRLMRTVNAAFLRFGHRSPCA